MTGMTSPPAPPPACPAADVTWVVALAGEGTRCRVLHPYGVSPPPEPARPVALTGTHRIDGRDVSWAFGYVAADAPTPVIAFLSHHGLRARPAAVRRLTATVWAAQLPGRWTHVRVA
jgi:hypothetical protein